MPALFFVILACLPFAWLWLLPSDLKDFANSMVATASFVSNIYFWSVSGYFDTAAEIKPLLHTWSLGVEEQFYFIFPIFLIFFWRRKRRQIITVLGLIFIFSFVLAEYAASTMPAAAFYLLPTRAWELLLGSFTAFYVSHPKSIKGRVLSEVGGFLGLALIFFSILTFKKDTPLPGIYALIPTVGTVFIISFTSENTIVGRFIGNKLFVSIGLISYSLYLWHQPLFAFARYKSISNVAPAAYLVLTLVSLILAYLSYSFVEMPFRKKEFISRKAVFLIYFGISLAFVFVGYFSKMTDGFEDYYVSNRLVGTQASNYALIKKHSKYDVANAVYDNCDCIFSTSDITEIFRDRFSKCALLYGKALVILGDSHGIGLFNIIGKSGVRKFVVGVAKGGCRLMIIWDFVNMMIF
jgi:peptidoglycan/LPS O-acetylase OafA/YrhL